MIPSSHPYSRGGVALRGMSTRVAVCKTTMGIFPGWSVEDVTGAVEGRYKALEDLCSTPLRFLAVLIALADQVYGPVMIQHE